MYYFLTKMFSMSKSGLSLSSFLMHISLTWLTTSKYVDAKGSLNIIIIAEMYLRRNDCQLCLPQLDSARDPGFGLTLLHDVLYKKELGDIRGWRGFYQSLESFSG